MPTLGLPGGRFVEDAAADAGNAGPVDVRHGFAAAHSAVREVVVEGAGDIVEEHRPLAAAGACASAGLFGVEHDQLCLEHGGRRGDAEEGEQSVASRVEQMGRVRGDRSIGGPLGAPRRGSSRNARWRARRAPRVIKDERGHYAPGAFSESTRNRVTLSNRNTDTLTVCRTRRGVRALMGGAAYALMIGCHYS